MSARLLTRGYILITSLVFLLVLTLLGVALLTGVTLEETMAHNMREKQRAIAAASAAARGVENYLAQVPVLPIPGANPTASPTALTVYTPTAVSSLDLAANASWRPEAGYSIEDTAGAPYATWPFNDPNVYGTGVSVGGTTIEYAEAPQLIVQQLPTTPLTGDNLAAIGASYGVTPVPPTYLITAWATGGSPHAVAVIQETYRP
ncbi:MAG: pilus assembly protein [Gammaproteobacteria bacterium]|nr:pilus assembly protein [Gammaproteobacteria bacterium]